MGRPSIKIVDGKKPCSKCKTLKSVTEFGVRTDSSTGLNNACINCVALEPCQQSQYFRDRRAQGLVKTKPLTKQQRAAKGSREYKALRAQILEAYGGCCACCGESTPEFLSIDHIYNDGAADRKRMGVGYPFYIKLRQKGFPKDRYQILCYNCNYAKSRYGACPHTRGKEVPLHLQGVYRFADGIEHVNGVVM